MIPVLLVDDDRELTEMLSLYLAREGFQATAVNTGEEGETQALSGHFQVVVLDVMPVSYTHLTLPTNSRV